ncbi:hypothetical protein B0H17DRAFT_1140990 [Mycena rosella]|uniref:Uncharacterized protein n=1 Tax=Mycena rosella TaxID=1033263 RepID=A0AAD7GBD8_MYCRO|nr:hypothetical protein B0H17DRAFT_1140990 [Mycena rosella]
MDASGVSGSYTWRGISEKVVGAVTHEIQPLHSKTHRTKWMLDMSEWKFGMGRNVQKAKEIDAVQSSAIPAANRRSASARETQSVATRIKRRSAPNPICNLNLDTCYEGEKTNTASGIKRTEYASPITSRARARAKAAMGAQEKRGRQGTGIAAIEGRQKDGEDTAHHAPRIHERYGRIWGAARTAAGAASVNGAVLGIESTYRGSGDVKRTRVTPLTMPRVSASAKANTGAAGMVAGVASGAYRVAEGVKSTGQMCPMISCACGRDAAGTGAAGAAGATEAIKRVVLGTQGAHRLASDVKREEGCHQACPVHTEGLPRVQRRRERQQGGGIETGGARLPSLVCAREGHQTRGSTIELQMRELWGRAPAGGPARQSYSVLRILARTAPSTGLKGVGTAGAPPPAGERRRARTSDMLVTSQSWI